jgi:RHS repeat-associated protein
MKNRTMRLSCLEMGQKRCKRLALVLISLIVLVGCNLWISADAWSDCSADGCSCIDDLASCGGLCANLQGATRCFKGTPCRLGSICGNQLVIIETPNDAYYGFAIVHEFLEVSWPQKGCFPYTATFNCNAGSCAKNGWILIDYVQCQQPFEYTDLYTFAILEKKVSLDPLPDGNLGPAPKPDPDPTPAPDICKKEGKGTPVWSVNKTNMNLYMVDTPIWYKPAIGPSVKIKLSYNSRATVDQYASFGNKWQLNYGSYLSIDSDGSVTVTMPDGRQDVYTFDGANYTKPFGVFNTLTKIADNHYQLSFLDGTVYDYGSPADAGLTRPYLVKITDAYGKRLAFAYSSGRLQTVTDAMGKVTTFQYSNGLVQAITDPFGRTASFEYDESGDLRKATDMGGYITRYSYNQGDNHYIASVRNPKGTWSFNIEPSDDATTTVAYPDPNAGAPKMGMMYRITITDPNLNKEEYYYNGTNTWYVSPRDYVAYVDGTTNNMTEARKTTYFLDRSLPEARVKGIVTPSNKYDKFTFDTATGLPATITDGNSRTTAFTYNTNGLVISFTDAKSRQTTVGYAPANNIDATFVTSGLGTITFEYNAAHDVTKMTDRMGYITEFTYNTNGRLLTVTEAKGTAKETITELVYDANKTLKDIKKAGVLVASLTHDDIGRIKTVTYPDGVDITYAYDNLNQTKTITYPDGKTESITNSTLCPYMVDSVTDRVGRTTNYQYDALKRLFQRDGPEGTYKYDYDANSNLIKFTDADNKVTTFGYNLDNRLKKKTYADGKSVSYTYDPAGLLKTYTNSRSQLATYGYDANNNLTAITYSSGATNVAFGYDAYNRMTSRTDAIGAFSYTYDANDRLKAVGYPWDSPAATITYGYNALNQLENITPLIGDIVSYNYDTLGRLKTIKRTTDTVPFTYDYDTSSSASPHVQTLTRPNGSYTQYEYDDPLKKLTAIINKKSNNEIINSYVYTYTNPNHPDLKNSETITNGTVIDNFTTGTTTYTPNNLNQVIASTNPARTYAYDNDGNMTTGFNPDGQAVTMTYDAENRLITAQFTDSSSRTNLTNYYYSGDGLLARMTKTLAGTLVSDTRYIRAGFLPIQERDANNNVTREYLWGLNYGGGIGGLLNLKQGGLDYNYLYDGKGNVTTLIGADQTPVVSYAYDPFGVLKKKVGIFDQPYQFSTKPYDPQTGLSEYGFRYYNAVLGKWMTRDPLGEYGGINLYRAMGNNPVNWVDPFGLEKLYILPPDDSFIARANSNPDIPGIMKIYAHCNSDFCVDKLKNKMSDMDLINRMIAGGYKTGMPFMIYGCNAGPVAQRLSLILGAVGMGPDGFLWDNSTYPIPYYQLGNNSGAGIPWGEGQWNLYIGGTLFGRVSGYPIHR